MGSEGQEILASRRLDGDATSPFRAAADGCSQCSDCGMLAQSQQQTRREELRSCCAILAQQSQQQTHRHERRQGLWRW